jgi:hypothetical protein
MGNFWWVEQRQDPGPGVPEVCCKSHPVMMFLEYALGSLGSRNCTMNSLIHWFTVYENALAVVVTVGVALFLVCCLECTSCSCRDKDEFFRRKKV